MPRPEPVLDRLDAADVIVRYAACIDERDFEAFRGCFVPEVELHGFAPEPIRGIEPWVDFVRGVIERFRATQHLLGPPHVTLDGDEASLRTELQAQHFYRAPEGRLFTLWGTYRSDLVRDAGTWRMRRHALATRATRVDEPVPG